MRNNREGVEPGVIVSEAEKPTAKRSGLWRPLLLISGILVLFVLARVFGVADRLGELRGWIETLGALGPLVFIALYVIAVTAAMPGSALTIVAGAIFGSALGIVVVSIGATIGASLSFLISRYFARDAAARWLSRNDKFRRLDELTGRHGAIIVALTRLVPLLPFNLLNYGFGLTRVPFWTYVFWSWLCMLPGTALYVIGADVVTRALAEGKVPWLAVVGLIIAGAAVVILVRIASRRLKEKEVENA